MHFSNKNVNLRFILKKNNTKTMSYKTGNLENSFDKCHYF